MLSIPMKLIAMIRILVLDDEKLIRWSLDKILVKDGYAVDAAATTEEALDLAAKSTYDLVLTDLEVCGGEAPSFLASLIAKQPAARLVALTALAREEAEKLLAGIPACAVVEKPFTSEAIRAVVHAALDRSNSPSTSPIKERNG